MIELTPQQRQELALPMPVAIDPDTKQTYVLVRKDIYDRFRALANDEGPDMQVISQLVDRAMREDDEHDPTLAFYQQKYGRKQ